jgi:hypothetical protein
MTILTTYLIEHQDMQRNQHWPADNDQIVEKWINSVKNIGLQGIIFYDNLSANFIEKWTNANIKFQKIEWKTPWGPCEERVQIYIDWLEQNDCDFILTTDLSDVEFYYDPTPLFKSKDTLYLEIEDHTSENFVWSTNKMLKYYGEITNLKELILNPGILGSGRNFLIAFLKNWIMEMKKAVGKPEELVALDLIAFNRLIYREKIPFISGFPLHTQFKKFESASCGAAIRHK